MRLSVFFSFSAAMSVASTLCAADALKVTKVWAGGDVTCALISDGRLKCWGYNAVGQLGLGDTATRGDSPGSMGDSLPAIDLGSSESVRSLALTNNVSCAVFEDYRSKCWGDTFFTGYGIDYVPRYPGAITGWMGEALPFHDMGTNSFQTLSVAAEPRGTCFSIKRSSGYQLKCLSSDNLSYGDVDYRILLLDQTEYDGLRGEKVEQVIAGSQFRCVLLERGKVKCWGSNTSEQLGHPAQSLILRNAPDVNLGSGKVLKLSGSGGFTCALFDNGRVKCWGDNSSGQLGIGSNASSWGSDREEMGVNLPYVDLGRDRTATDIVTGNSHVCALLDNKGIKCWGSNNSGRLGLGDTRARGTSPGDMGDNLPYVDLGGFTANAIASGGRHICAILSNGGLKCWGANDSGQLGLEDTMTRGGNPADMGSHLPFIRIWD